MFGSVKPSEYMNMDSREKEQLKRDRLCDGNWSALHPYFRKIYLVEDLIRMSRRCDADAGKGC